MNIPPPRIRALLAFYGLRVKRKFQNESAPSKFLGYSIYSTSGVNLITILREVFLFGDYYFKAPSDAPVIIDCGGNIGITTLFFKWLYPKAHITVLEPAPLNIETLRRNIEMNRLTDITVIEAAASDHEGTITFWEDRLKPGSSTMVGEVYETKSKDIKRVFVECQVNAIKLSSHIPAKVDLLKMDIEGAEGIVIGELAVSGALARIDNIIFEYHDNKANASNNLPKLLTLLEESGFNTVIFGTELGPSSERLIQRKGGHFLIRASRR